MKEELPEYWPNGTRKLTLEDFSRMRKEMLDDAYSIPNLTKEDLERLGKIRDGLYKWPHIP